MDVSEKPCYWAECIIESQHTHIFETKVAAYKKKVADYRVANAAAKTTIQVRVTKKAAAAIAETERQYKDAKPKP